MYGFKQVVESLPERINVVQAGGIIGGRSPPTENQVKDRIRLDGLSFLSRATLPDMPTITKIQKAVCGVPDTEDRCSPSKDGWFLSDFFLLHHIFKPVAEDQESMLCESPHRLVQKYGEYSQGAPPRVVMDASLLGEVNEVKHIQPDRLLPVFLQCLTRALREAERDGRHLIVIVLSHGYGADKN